MQVSFTKNLSFSVIRRGCLFILKITQKLFFTFPNKNITIYY